MSPRAARQAAPAPAGVRGLAPGLAVERELLAAAGEGALLIGCDEVGRGAIAGPVAVGLGVLAPERGLPPQRLRDSKLLSPSVRESLLPELDAWLGACSVGFVDAERIDRMGIIGALRSAACAAFSELASRIEPGRPVVVLLDGTHDWIGDGFGPGVRVVVRAKADLHCASVAAASVVAKVRRDALMVRLHDEAPHFGWNENKGYASPAHCSALVAHGPSPWHRRSWLSRILESGGVLEGGAPAVRTS